MKVERLAIPDVLLVCPRRHGDAHGYLSETYNARSFAAAGIDRQFVQDNHSLSRPQGTVRGLHFQIPPMAQAKLVRVLRGAVLDVAVDIRAGSPSFGRHVAAVLSAEGGLQMFIPEGFAHGFCTLEPDTEVLYKVSGYYSAEHDKGMLWNDPALGIDWPVTDRTAVLSEKDTRHPTLARLPEYFSSAADDC